MEFNASRSEYARKRYEDIARELGLKDAQELINAVRELNERLGVPKLSELVDEETFISKVEEMAEKAYRDGLMAFNPVEAKPEEIRELYLKAFYGG